MGAWWHYGAWSGWETYLQIEQESLVLRLGVKRHGKVTPSEGGQAAKNDPFLRNGFTMAFMLNGGPVWDACC
ncbi:hypothetical protein OQZ28_15420, partial [Komagataeibacter sp. NFXK3]